MGALKTVLLIMRRASLAQGLMVKVRDAPGFQLCYEPDYANADVAIRTHLAAGALLEVSEDGAHDIDFCLALCAWLREVTPHCRLMLMCPEGQTEVVNRAIAAKRKGEIAPDPRRRCWAPWMHRRYTLQDRRTPPPLCPAPR